LAHGVPGNFHLREGVDLCCAAGIGRMLGHHYGMLDFNTVDRDDSEREIARWRPAWAASLLRAGLGYELLPRPAA
jgi:hypothetical protein